MNSQLQDLAEDLRKLIEQRGNLVQEALDIRGKANELEAQLHALQNDLTTSAAALSCTDMQIENNKQRMLEILDALED